MNLKHLVILALGLLLPGFLRAGNFPPVQITEDDFSFTLNNGVVSAQVAKRSGNLIALQYQAQEMLDVRDHEAAYWSHNVAHDRQASRITIDPRTNDGERGEVSLTGFAATNGPQNLEVEIRYTLARGDSGLYTYSILSHATNYPATSIGEARFCMKLSDELFDWMTVDGRRDMKMITAYDWNHGTEMNFKEGRRMNTGQYKGMVEHKYDYSANQFEVRAWGWSSSARQIGIWLVNPSVEYLSGGPTKFELSAHRDATFRTNAFAAPAPPTLLNYPPNADDSEPLLPAVGILAGLSERSLRNIAAYGTFLPCQTGTEVIRQGAHQERVFVVVQGRLAVLALRGGRRCASARPRARCLGEVSLLEPGPAWARCGRWKTACCGVSTAPACASSSPIIRVARAFSFSAWRPA